MANEDNLKPVRTESEARELGRKGGIASGKARREKRELRACLEALLEKEYVGTDGATMSGAELISAKLFLKARDGDIRAFEVLRDTVGQKPVERVESVEIPPEVYERVERVLSGEDG